MQAGCLILPTTERAQRPDGDGKRHSAAGGVLGVSFICSHPPRGVHLRTLTPPLRSGLDLVEPIAEKPVAILHLHIARIHVEVHSHCLYFR
jgi:hypothetical protein